MEDKGSQSIKDKDHTQTGRSGKKSYQLVFWLLVAKIILILLLVGLSVWLIYSVRSAGSGNRPAVSFAGVSGSGYTEDGKKLWIASSSGIVAYENGIWKKESSSQNPAGSRFLPVKNGYIQISPDGTEGQQKTLAGQKETAFRISGAENGGAWAAGYATSALYRLKENGNRVILSFSDDGGKTWIQRRLNGIRGSINAVAAHPRNTAAFAVATTRGLFLTANGGRSFQTILGGQNVSCVAYGFGAKVSLLAGTIGQQTGLYSIIPSAGKAINLDMGSVESDRLVLIVASPVHDQESVVLTNGGDAYSTTNGGQNWVVMAQKGRTLSGK